MLTSLFYTVYLTYWAENEKKRLSRKNSYESPCRGGLLLTELARKQGAEKIVVGLPKNMDGTIGFRGEETYKFTDALKTVYEGEIIYWDERLSTVSAANILNETNRRGKKRKEVLDTVAASIILENYLNSIR